MAFTSWLEREFAVTDFLSWIYLRGGEDPFAAPLILSLLPEPVHGTVFNSASFGDANLEP